MNDGQWYSSEVAMIDRADLEHMLADLSAGLKYPCCPKAHILLSEFHSIKIWELP